MENNATHYGYSYRCRIPQTHAGSSLSQRYLGKGFESYLEAELTPIFWTCPESCVLGVQDAGHRAGLHTGLTSRHHPI
eukprot:10304726-Ditylum_brightwellii.AAC.1